ncbi:MAG: cysteine--tRNA ligase, partial [Candidatus Limnocylindria bacterium]
TAHYRSKLDFTNAAMHAAASGLRRLRRAASPAVPGVDLTAQPMASYRARFVEAIADDLATPRALALAHEVANAADVDDSQRASLLGDFDRVLGLSLDRPAGTDAPLPAGADELLERRAAARASRDYGAADALRDELAELGVTVRDTPTGQEASRRE